MLLTRYIPVMVAKNGVFMPLSDDEVLDKARSKLVDAHKVGSLLTSLGTPRCLWTYKEDSWEIRTKLEKMNPPGINSVSHYSPAWLLRSQLLITLRSQGINELCVPKDFMVDDLEDVFPDG